MLGCTAKSLATRLLATGLLTTGLLTTGLVGVTLASSAQAESSPILKSTTQATGLSTPELTGPELTNLKLTGELEGELETLGDVIEKEIRDRIDPEALEQAARPIVRRSLRTVLDVAPDLSRKAIILGEWYLGQWGDRALEELESAAEKLEDFENKL